MCGKKLRGRPRLTWIDDIINWTGVETYEKIKKAAEDRSK